MILFGDNYTLAQQHLSNQAFGWSVNIGACITILRSSCRGTDPPDSITNKMKITEDNR